MERYGLFVASILIWTILSTLMIVIMQLPLFFTLSLSYFQAIIILSAYLSLIEWRYAGKNSLLTFFRELKFSTTFRCDGVAWAAEYVFLSFMSIMLQGSGQTDLIA